MDGFVWGWEGIWGGIGQGCVCGEIDFGRGWWGARGSLGWKMVDFLLQFITFEPSLGCAGVSPTSGSDLSIDALGLHRAGDWTGSGGAGTGSGGGIGQGCVCGKIDFGRGWKGAGGGCVCGKIDFGGSFVEGSFVA